MEIWSSCLYQKSTWRRCWFETSCDGLQRSQQRAVWLLNFLHTWLRKSPGGMTTQKKLVFTHLHFSFLLMSNLKTARDIWNTTNHVLNSFMGRTTEYGFRILCISFYPVFLWSFPINVECGMLHGLFSSCLHLYLQAKRSSVAWCMQAEI